MNKDIKAYNDSLDQEAKEVCELLRKEIDSNLSGATSKIWHGHPVWFINDNPIVGYSKLKGPVRLLFWSGQSFEEDGLLPEGTFKAAEVRYTNKDQIISADLRRWLDKSTRIQWDYKNIVKRRGELIRL